MTVVLGFSDSKGNVHIAADSGSFTNCERYVSKVDKVFMLGSEFLVGFAGSWRQGNIIRYDFIPPPRPDGIDDMAYLVSYFVDSLRELLKSKGFSAISDNVETTGDGLMLLGYKGKLYTIDSDFSVNTHIDCVDSIGAGSLHCISAFDALSSMKDIRKRMLKALDVTEKRCIFVSRPYNYMVLKNGK